MKIRFDRGTLSKVKYTGAGALRVPVSISRPGDLQYYTPDGVVIESRPKEEAFAEDSVQSLEGLPVTWDHPDGYVTPENWKELAIGHLDDPRVEGDWVVADAIISDENAINNILKLGVEFVSAGYGTDVEDGIQRNVRYNHLAILPPGKTPRAGAGARLHLDSNGNQVFEKGNKMEEEQVKTLIAEAMGPILEQLAAIGSVVEEMKKGPETTVADAVTPPAEDVKMEDASKEKARADAAEAALELFQKQLPSIVDDLADARDFAKSLGVSHVGKSLIDLRKDCADKVFEGKVSLGNSEQINAFFEAAKKISTSNKVSTFLSEKRSDSANLTAYEKHELEMSRRGR